MARTPQIRYRSGKPTNAQRATAEMLRSFAIELQTWMFDNDRVASEDAINSFFIEVFRGVIFLDGIDYLPFTLQGRESGLPPPIDAIRDWISDKGLQADDGDNEGFAWAVRQTIADKGTAPPHLSSQEIDAMFNKSFIKFQDRIVDGVEDQVLERIDGFLKKADDKNENIKIIYK